LKQEVSHIQMEYEYKLKFANEKLQDVNTNEKEKAKV
jgi:hypothetical protein